MTAALTALAQPNDFPPEERHLVLSIARQCGRGVTRAQEPAADLP